MNKGGYRVFWHQPEKLQEMLYLREFKHWSYPKLAKKFNCDHTSIYFQCARHGLVKPRNPSLIQRIKNKIWGKREGYCSKCGIRLTPDNIKDCDIKGCELSQVDK
jgi:hypothetical protein